MPIPDERPEWAIDAINNPVNPTAELDPYAPFDPESEETYTDRIATTYQPPKLEQQVERYAQDLSAAYSTTQDLADDIELQHYKNNRIKKFRFGDMAQLLLGDELGAVGIQLDGDEAQWKADIAIQQWSEHPLRTSIALASWMLPGAGKLLKMRRAGQLANITADEVVAANKIESVDAFNLMSKEDQMLAVQAVHHDTKYVDLVAKAEMTPESLTTGDKVNLWFYKNWAHTYSKLSDPSSSAVHNINFHNKVKRTLKDEVIDPLYGEIPDTLMDGPDLGLFLIGRKPLEALPEASRTWANNFKDELISTQSHANEIGLIDEGTLERIGEAYVPVLMKQHEKKRLLRPETETQIIMKGNKPVQLETPRLTSEALMHRETTLDEFAEMMERGEVLTDPKNLTLRGLAEQKMLIMSSEHIRDMFIKERFSATAAEVAERGEDLKDWVQITQIPHSDKIIRMMKQRPLAAGGPRSDIANTDRYIRMDAFEQVFGKNGLVGQANEATKFLEGWVRQYKTAKCVVGDTRILTSHGYMKIKEAFEYKDGYKETTEDSLKVWTPSLGWEIPHHTYKECMVPTIKVTLRDGTIIEGTSDHPLFSEDKEVKLGELKVGDIIDTYHYGGAFPEQKIKVPWNVWQGESGGSNYIELDEDIAELFGWILGDGNIWKSGKSYHMRITIGYEDFEWSSSRLSQLCDRIGLSYTVWREKEIREGANGLLSYFNIFNAPFGRLLRHLEIVDGQKKRLRVPEVIFRSPRTVVVSFLRGLCNTDGNVSKKGEISLPSVSKKLQQEVHLLFKWIGIASSIHYSKGDKTITFGKRKYEYKNHESWKIRFAGRPSRIIAFKEQLFGIPRKAKRIEESILRQKRNVSRSWKIRVKSIERGPLQDVYDICLDDPHVFIAEGLPVKNTALNLFTQNQNIMGNLAFLSQAGFRLFTGPDKVQNWKALTAGMRNVNMHYKARTGKVAEASFSPMTVGGKTWSPDEIASELESGWVYDLIEEGAFLRAEGSNGAMLTKMAERAEDINDFLGKTANAGKNELDRWKRYYNVGDGGPKFTYYLSLRGKGFTPQAAATEVARRLPVYNGISVGPKVPGLGRIGPASLRKWMFPWISFPAEAMRITKNNTIDYPMRMAAWFHAPQIVQSLVYGGSHALGVGEPLSYQDYDGIRKGLPLYAQNSSTVTLPFKDRNNDFRAMLLNSIPHFTFMPQTTAPEAGVLEKIPVVSPIDVAPILIGMYGLMTGKGPFGQEVQYTDKSDLVGKVVANTLGFVTPPFIQKYFFNITSPRENMLSGLNTYKLEQDLGNVVNPMTGKPGSWLADVVINNSVMKNYASSGEQELHNRELNKSRNVDRVRKELTRRFNASIRSGDSTTASRYLMEVYNTFIKEYTPGAVAQEKWSDWLIRHRRLIMKHPQLRRYSEEELTRYIIDVNKRHTGERNVGLDNVLGAIRKEITRRHSMP